MTDYLCSKIAKLLTDEGYTNVQYNCGSIWYDCGGKTFCISEIECED